MNSGILLVDKPQGITSHDVVARTRRLAGTRKVGHAGTLDPMATGLLVLGVDSATRLLHLPRRPRQGVPGHDPARRGDDTDDAEGEPLAASDAAERVAARRPTTAIAARHRAR